MKNLKPMLPGAFTSFNLILGFLASVNSFKAVEEGNWHLLYISCWLIMLGIILDGLDGKVARLTHTSSDFGIEFDSLADIIGFGVAPASILYNFSRMYKPDFSGEHFSFTFLLPVFFLLMGAIRLAKFNTTATTGSKSGFTGLPIPSAAGTTAAFIMLHIFLFNRQISGDTFLSSLKDNVSVFITGSLMFSPDILYGAVLIMAALCAILMVSTFEYDIAFAFVFRGMGPKRSKAVFIGLFLFFLLYSELFFVSFGIAYLSSGILKFFLRKAFPSSEENDGYRSGDEHL
ncbi:MAG: CDP-diacylglycerol--serine O-phosphatidyltransferase [Fibrobacterota bacterium]